MIFAFRLLSSWPARVFWGLLCAGLSGAGQGPGVVDRRAAIEALMETSRSMESIPFREVVLAASGHPVVAFDADSGPDKALMEHLSKAGDALLAWLNGPGNPAGHFKRINEASSLVEEKLRTLLNAGEFGCTRPPTASGKAQRTGYPDLQILHRPSGRITYLDPKLFAAEARSSSLRSFYYEPNALTGKVSQPARHLLLGISHDGKSGKWAFGQWELLDLFHLQVRLKAEFQSANRDIYKEKLLLRKSR